MVVQHAHGAAEHLMAQSVRALRAISGDQVMQIEREGRAAGLPGAYLPRHIEVAPPGIGYGLIEEKIEAILFVFAFGGDVRRLCRDVEAVNAAQGRHFVVQQRAQRGRGGGDGERVAHRPPRRLRYSSRPSGWAPRGARSCDAAGAGMARTSTRPIVTLMTGADISGSVA